MKDKKFDAVRMMREIRDKLSKRYVEDQEAEERDLQDIRKKYVIKSDSQKPSFGEKLGFYKEDQKWIN